jgi:hypothetical protein
MARSFTRASSHYLQVESAAVTGPPYTMACWGNSNSATVNQTIMYLGDSTSDGRRAQLELRGNDASDPVAASTSDTAAAYSSSTINGYTANTWQHYAGVWASTTSRIVYLNGTAGTENTTSRVTGTPNRMAIGGLRRLSPTDYMSGLVADAAIWNVALSAAEIAALARGVSPLRIRPGNIAAYWPLFGTAGPEINICGGSYHLTVSGATQAAHAPVMPACGESIDWIPYSVAVGGFIPAWASGSNVLIGGAF